MANNSGKRYNWILQKIVIPTSVITFSGAILTGAYWYHEKQLAIELKKSLSGQSISLPANAAGQNTTLQQRPPVLQHKKKRTTTPITRKTKKHTNTSTSTTKTGQEASQVTTTKAKAPTTTNPVKKVTPSGSKVSGGLVTSVQQPSVADTEIQAQVLQYGQNPQTSGIVGSLKHGQSSLTIPSSIDVHQLLALSLGNGVLWTIVPSTSVTTEGNLGPSVSPTKLFYTPFPTMGSQPLSAHAIQIGVVPTSVKQPKDLGTSWFGYSQPPNPSTNSSDTANVDSTGNATNSVSTETTPAAKEANGTSAPTSKSNATGNRVANGTTLNTTSNGSSGANPSTGKSTTDSTSDTTTGSNQTSSQFANKTSNLSTAGSVANGMTVYVAEFDKVTNGAVIVLNVSNTTETDTLLYSYQPATRSIRLLTTLVNNGSNFSWFAVGTDNVFWGTHTVNANNPSTYDFKQYESFLNSDVSKQISLGTWTSTAYANGDNLIFQVGQKTTTWEKFQPSGLPTQTPAKSK